MAKSIRSKREKRLRAIRRDLVEPFYDKKDAAKQAALEAALAAPKLSTSKPQPSPFSAMDATTSAAADTIAEMDGPDVMMSDENDNQSNSKSSKSLKPVGKKLKKKLKFGKKKRRHGGRGKIKKRRI